MAVSEGGKDLCRPMPLKSHSVLPLREVRARAEAEAVKECCLLAAPCDVLCLHPYTTQDLLARDGTAHSGTYHVNKENL